MHNPSQSWFAVRELRGEVWLIAEPGHVNSFLVLGSDRAALIDSGLGIGDIQAASRLITDKPITVINTHSHFDHVGGNHLFEDIAIHEAEADQLEGAQPEAMLRWYGDYLMGMSRQWQEYVRANPTAPQYMSDEQKIRPVPEGFAPDAYRVLPSRATRRLKHGDIIDLGDRRLEVLHTPGHSPGSVCLLDEQNEVLFAGDVVNQGQLLAQLPGSDLRQYSLSAESLANYAPRITSICPGHFSIFLDRHILHEMAEGLGRLLRDEVQTYPVQDPLGGTVHEARFERFSILFRP